MNPSEAMAKIKKIKNIQVVKKSTKQFNNFTFSYRQLKKTVPLREKLNRGLFPTEVDFANLND